MGGAGVQFPVVDGRRSTQRTGRDVFAAAAAVVDPGLAVQIREEAAWRTAYPVHLRQLTAAAARSSTAGAAVARAGLDRTHVLFEHRDGAAARPVYEAVAAGPATALRTRTVAGAGVAPAELSIPYRGRDLRGDDLLAVVDDWVARGIAEPAARSAIARLVDRPDWLDLRGHWFAVLGAGAEMAPTDQLLRWGADVAAVDVRRDEIWRRLERAAIRGTGRLHVPARDADGGSPLGADLLTDAAAVRAWLEAFDQPMVLGNYAYADGETFARVSVAADAVIAAILRARSTAGAVCLATPTDVFAVPGAVAHETRARVPPGWSRALSPLLRHASRGRLLVRSHRDMLRTEAGEELGLADGLVLQQGPNYALAKRLQRWRALVTCSDGRFGAIHVAPPTRTASVVRNRVLAAAYEGASLFGVEVFAPATSRTLMAALLVHDLRIHASRPAPPGRAEHELTAAAVHGGLWRVAWEPRTALPLAVLTGAPALLAGRSAVARNER